MRRKMGFLGFLFLAACGNDIPQLPLEDARTPVAQKVGPGLMATTTTEVVPCQGAWGQCRLGEGHVEQTANGAVCSTDPGGSQSRAQPERCDGTDADCDGLVGPDCSSLPRSMTLAQDDGLGGYFRWTADEFVQSAWAVCIGQGGHNVATQIVGRNGWFGLNLPVQQGPYRCQVWGTGPQGRRMSSPVLVTSN